MGAESGNKDQMNTLLQDLLNSLACYKCRGEDHTMYQTGFVQSYPEMNKQNYGKTRLPHKLSADVQFPSARFLGLGIGYKTMQRTSCFEVGPKPNSEMGEQQPQTLSEMST